ncbi:MAG: serpin family protein [Lachnospiraceae bacterium]|nr:serpin family protein [Lachnospiraceae bacterium]
MKRWKRITGIILAVTISASLCGCGDKKRFKPKAKDTVVLNADLKSGGSSKSPDAAFKKAYADFTIGLFRELRKTGAEFVSPYSMYSVLAVAMNGAGGETLEEMRKVLGLSVSELNGYMKTFSDRYAKSEVVATADSVWVNSTYRKTIQKGFLQDATDYYRADVISADFNDKKTADDMNAWIRAKTLGRIEDMVSPDELDVFTVMVLFNCLTFDGKWTKKFEKDATSDKPFHMDDGTTRTVKMMHGRADAYFETDDYVGIDKNYEDGFLFRAYLPKEGTAEELLWKLDADRLINPGNYDGNAYLDLPRISLVSQEMDMTSALKALGMESAFSKSAAEFPKLSTVECYLEKVSQKTYLVVDEEGTKAAAASKGLFKAKSMDYVPHQVTLDHSFIYGIYDAESGIPLFIGIYQ